MTRKTGSDLLRGWDWNKDVELTGAVGLNIQRGFNRAPRFSFGIPRDSKVELQLGDFIRIERDGDPFISGVITDETIQTQNNQRSCNGLGILTILTKTTFPPNYRLRGNLNSALNKSRLTCGYTPRRISSSSPAANNDWDGKGVLSWNGKTNGTGSEIAVLTNVVIAGSSTQSLSGDGKGALALSGSWSIDGIQQPPVSASGTYLSPYIDVRSPTGGAVEMDAFQAVYSEGKSKGAVKVRLTKATASGVANRTFTGDKTTLLREDEANPNAPAKLTLSGAASYVFIELTLERASDQQTIPLEVFAVDVIGRYALQGVAVNDTGGAAFPAIDIGQLHAGGQNLWSVLNSICNNHQLECWEDGNGELNIGNIPSAGNPSTGHSDKSVEYTFEENAYVAITDFQLDDRALANVIRIIGPGDKNDAEILQVQDADSIQKYGIREKTVNIGDNNRGVNINDFDALKQRADNILAQQKITRYLLNVRIQNAPHGKLNLNPGDIIRIHSNRFGLTREPVDLKARIIDDDRQVNDFDGSETITLTLETAPPPNDRE